MQDKLFSHARQRLDLAAKYVKREISVNTQFVLSETDMCGKRYVDYPQTTNT